ncbi:unnamed protein product [Sphagnum troendelagicum]|uniref:Uncharacterized protein n=1 Tax=Sphagnum troendelagicum TaxID=128251 RepID=A0ABP0V432_9BRYO
MRGSGTYKEKERQKAVLNGTMVVGLAVNCGMLPWLFMAFQRAFTCAPVTICLQWSGKQTYSTPSIFVMVSGSRLMTVKCKSGVLEAAGDGSGKRVSEAAGDGFAKRLQVMGAVENPVKCEASKKVPKG